MLNRAGGASLSDIAEDLNVTPRSARRYLKEFSKEFEIEKVLTRGGATRWRVKSVERPKNIGLRRTQCYALLATRRLFHSMHGSSLYLEFERAVDDLMVLANRPGRGPNAGLIDSGMEERFLHMPAEPADYADQSDDLDVFYHAVVELRSVQCSLRSSAPTEITETPMTLHPYAMVLYQDGIHIVAADASQPKNEARVFQLHDLRNATLQTTERFELPEGFNLQSLYQGQFGLFPSSRTTKVVVDLDAWVADAVRHRQVHPSQKVSNQRGGGLRITFDLGDVGSVAKWVLGFGSHARVIGPKVLRDLVINELAAALTNYRESSAV